MAQTCPRCGLLNPAGAARCDCGYDLVSQPAASWAPVDLGALFFSSDGRIGRATFWLKFALPYLAIYLVLLAVDNMIGTADAKGDIGFLSGAFLLIGIYPYLVGCVKRCHDRDKTGFFLLVSVVPILNLWVTIELGFLAGMPWPNRYGAPEGWADVAETRAPTR